MDAEGDPMGPMAERILYQGPIRGYQPGQRNGLVCEFTGMPPKLAYKVTLDVAEKALKAEMQRRAPAMRACIQHECLEGAKLVRAEWSRVLHQLLTEKRMGQLGELYWRTQRIITTWEEEQIPNYVARTASLEQTVAESETELEQLVQRMHQRGKRKQHMKGERRRESQGCEAPPLSKREVGPQETNPPGKGLALDERYERRQPRTLGEQDITRLVERACAECEASMLAQIEGLLWKQSTEQRPPCSVRSSNRKRELSQGQSVLDRPVAGADQSQERELNQTREVAESSHPALRRYFQSPYVDVAQKFQEVERKAKQRRERSAEA
jgi:hypothetical protein